MRSKFAVRLVQLSLGSGDRLPLGKNNPQRADDTAFDCQGARLIHLGLDTGIADACGKQGAEGTSLRAVDQA